MRVEDFAVEFLEHISQGAWTPGLQNKIARILERNYKIDEVGEILGEGSFGVAARLGDSEVLKLTTDIEELNTSFYLIGRDLVHVAKIYASCFLDDLSVYHDSTGTALPIGIVILERLDSVGLESPDDDTKLRVINHDIKSLYDVYPDHLATMPADKARDYLDAASEAMMIAFEDEAQVGDPDLLELAAGIKELREIGVYYVDAHPGNVGFSDKDGVYKLFDLGVSSLPGGDRGVTAEVCMRPPASMRGKRWPFRPIHPKHSVPSI